MLRAGQRDVREAQVLAALLGLVLALVGGEVGAVHADVDDALVAGLRVVEEDRLGVVAGSSPAPTGRGSRRSGTRRPCCGGW